MILLLLEIRIFHWIMRKAFQTLYTEDCDVARFIQVMIFPWVSNFPSPSIPPWKKSNCVFSKAKTKAKVQSFCFILRFRLWKPHRLLQALVAARPLVREKTHHWTGSEVREREREIGRDWETASVLLCSPGIILAWVCDGPGAFSKLPVSFPSFLRLVIGPPLVRLTGLYGQAPPPVPPPTIWY